MQGGRSDSSVLGRWGRLGSRASDTESDGYESELEVTSRISLGTKLDAAIHTLRTAFAVAISLPIAWLTLNPSIGAFRERKFRVVEEGTKTVVRIQKALRNPFLDKYFAAFSFCAEEEFYLLVLPFIIWNVDRVLGVRLTYVVCVGLIVGNIMKDVFALPRPLSPPAWRPKDLYDTTNLCDFGFPSTHAMNAVSNSLFTFLYVVGVSPTGPINLVELFGPVENRILLGACLFYIFSLCFSRLYLGAHTPTDLRGGMTLGVVWVAIYFAVSESVDAYLLSTNMLGLKLVGAATVLLLLNPQPRPVTPTIAQNALLCGLIMGAALGSRHYADLEKLEVVDHDTGSQIFMGPYKWGVNPDLASMRDMVKTLSMLHASVKGVLRTVIGFIFVLVLRIMVKEAVKSVLGFFNIGTAPNPQPSGEDASPAAAVDTDPSADSADAKAGSESDRGPPAAANEKKSATSKSEEPSPRRHRPRTRIVRLFTRDIDLVGNAILKVCTYTAMAWAITFLVPCLHVVLSLSRYDHLK